MKLGLPSKGRLKKEVLGWFYDKGIKIITSDDDRSYSAKVSGFSDIQLIFLPPIEIPILLMKGELDLGVTGQDLIEEKIPEWDKYIKELIKFGISISTFKVEVITVIRGFDILFYLVLIKVDQGVSAIIPSSV